MSAFPGLTRTKEIQKRSYDVPPRFLEHSPSPVDKKARVQPLVSPYFKSQSTLTGEIPSVRLAQKATDVLISTDRTTQSSNARLDPWNGPVSPPLLKRHLDLMTSESRDIDVPPSLEPTGLSVRSPKGFAFQLSARDFRAVTDTDVLHTMHRKPRRGLDDDNSSTYSAETRLSGSTSSRTRKTTCRECKYKGHAGLPLMKCSTCTNRFHDNEKCINPKFCEVKSKEEFRCRQCVSKGGTRVMTSLPLPTREAVWTLTPASPNSTPDFDAFTRSPSLLNIPKLPRDIDIKKDTQAQHSAQKVQDDPKSRLVPTPLSHQANNLPVSKPRSVDTSIAPKEPAAMRENLSPISHRHPHTNNLMDSYRPAHLSSLIGHQEKDVYRSSARSRPPSMHLWKEREKFLRNATEDERDHYLRQNRKEMSKEIICPYWGSTGGCRKRDICLYGHEEAFLSFPSKGWTCGAWLMERSGCRDKEEDCVFAHYDTGFYADIRGHPSRKHVTCFFWSREVLSCSRGLRCKFAHHDTGIVAEDPGFHKRGRSPPFRRLRSPERRTSDFWRPEAGMTHAARLSVGSSPPPVRDTPLSLVVPSESESEEYEPVSIQTFPNQDHVTESIAISSQLRPQAIAETPSAAIVEPADRARGSLDGSQLETLANSVLPKHSKSLRLDTEPTEEAPLAPVVPVPVPRQFARRTGGLKLRRITDPLRKKQATTILETFHNIPSEGAEHAKDVGREATTKLVITSDPRLRKPAVASLERSQKINGEETGPIEDAVKDFSTQPHSALLKCQTCNKMVMPSQAAKHKCQRTVSDQAGLSQQPSGSASSKANGVTDSSTPSHSVYQNSLMNGRVDQVPEPDVSTAWDNMGHIFSRNLPASSTPDPAIRGLKRNASGFGVDDPFLSNKRRNMGPPVLLRASTSAVSPVTSLSLQDLTELAALRKEFDCHQEWQSGDDTTTLKLLQAKKKKKTDWEERLAREDEAEEAAYTARLLKEKERRHKKFLTDLAAQEAEGLAQAEHDRKARESLREQAAQGSRRKSNGNVEIADTAYGSTSSGIPTKGSVVIPAQSSLSLHGTTSTTPDHRPQNPNSDEDPTMTAEFDKRFNGVFSIISPTSAASITRASGPLPMSRLPASTGERVPYPKDASGLVTASSDSPDGGDVAHDEVATSSAKACSQLGPRRTACEECRTCRIKCRHHGIPLRDFELQHATHDISINIAPQELSFKRPLKNEVTGTLKLSNPNAMPVEFKIATTAPKQYCGRPNHGTILPGRETEVKILLRPMKEDPPLDTKCHDKIFVQAAAVGPDDDSFKIGSTWSNIDKTNKSSFYEQIIRVIFLPADSRTTDVEAVDFAGASPALLARIPACVNCQKKRKKCHHDPISGECDPVRAEIPPQKRPRITPDSLRSVSTPRMSMTPQSSTPEPMHASILAGMNATKIATNALTQAPLAIVPGLITANSALNLTGNSSTAEPEADKSLINHPLRSSTDDDPDYQAADRSCADCGQMWSRRPSYSRFGGSGGLLCFRCYMSRLDWKTRKNRPVDDQNSEDRAPKDTLALRRPSDSVAAGLAAAKALASGVIAKASTSTPDTTARAPSGIPPADILALFCQSILNPERIKEPVPWSDSVEDDHEGPRLIQSRILSEEELAATIARMRAQGITVISEDGNDSDSDSPWSDPEANEGSRYPVRSIPWLKGTRYKEEPDPRRWVDEVEDEKIFDAAAAQRRIKARLPLKANVKALKNYTKPGKLLAMSDWQSRVRKYGSFHREVERDPGPQKLGTYVREVADRTKLTIPRGFDGPEVLKQEVRGTMAEFLGLPERMKYDLTDSDRLIGARTLAFSDAHGRGRVADMDRFPVGRGRVRY